MQPTRIHLVRHGEVHNPGQILYGRLPRFALSRRGHEQARISGSLLKTRPIAALYSSPMLRARQTARGMLLTHTGSKASISRYLNEVYTVYEGWPSATVDARQGDVYSGSPVGYEQPVDLVRRSRIFIARILKQHRGHEVVAVTHGDIIAFTVLWAMHYEPSPSNKSRLLQAGYAVAYPQHASITTLTFQTHSTDERPRIDYRNPAADI